MRAESLLERMRILSSTGRNPGVEPDSISVSTVISCHARSRTRRGAESGERMLDDAIDMYSRGNSRVKPDSIMFNCAITGKRGEFVVSKLGRWLTLLIVTCTSRILT